MHFWLKKPEKERENCTQTTAAAALLLERSWPPPPFLRIRPPSREQTWTSAQRPRYGVGFSSRIRPSPPRINCVSSGVDASQAGC